MATRLVNPRRPCKTISDFIAAVSDIQRQWRHRKFKSKGDAESLWFRGQSSAQWDLRPRFYRSDFGSLESEIRLEFEGNGMQLNLSAGNWTKWDWYFLMQHYGAPTRLLDWTGNPLVALYFAVEDEQTGRKEDAAVWAFDPWRWNTLHGDGLRGPALPGWKETKGYLPSLEDACNWVHAEKEWPIAIEPPSMDPRLGSQTARFLLFGKRKDLVKAADRSDGLSAKNRKQARLLQISISRKSCDEIRSRLDDLGVNRRTLFPDFQGLGAYLSWRWKRYSKKRRLY